MGKKYVRIQELDSEKKKDAKVIALMNNKGGCGKTTTAMALGMYLARTGHNVLFWDHDPQCNLTQRLGMPDENNKIKRMDFFYDHPNEKPDISILMEYPYLQRLHGSKDSPGKIALVPGSHMAEHYARGLDSRFNDLGKMFREQVKYQNIFHYFIDQLNYYKNYFQYIIIDTAPALEGNTLNRLSIQTADEFIIPIDGLDAALNLMTLLDFMDTQTKMRNPRPNGIMTMVKYQSDTKNLQYDMTKNAYKRIRNSVYRVLKNSFGNFVCDSGVRELRSLRHATKGIPGFGGKTDYTRLCEEVISKINEDYRDNIFEFSIKNGLSQNLRNDLSVLETAVRKRIPKYKVPKYLELSDGGNNA